MGVKLSDIVKGTRTIKVPFGEHVLNITYRLAERTPERNALVGVEIDDVSDTIVRLVESWDLEGTAGKPVPITTKGLSKVPVPVLRAVLWSVLGDTGLGEAPGSSNGG